MSCCLHYFLTQNSERMFNRSACKIIVFIQLLSDCEFLAALILSWVDCIFMYFYQTISYLRDGSRQFCGIHHWGYKIFLGFFFHMGQPTSGVQECLTRPTSVCSRALTCSSTWLCYFSSSFQNKNLTDCCSFCVLSGPPVAIH